MNINDLLKNIASFFVLLVLQILIFNNIGITSWEILPAFFLLIILLLPIEIPDWVLLITSFVIGLIIDIFSDTMGLNSSACLLLAFLRPLILRTISPRGGYDAGTHPRVHHMGLPWFLKYSSVLVFSHQLAYYFLEDFTFDHVWRVLIKVFIGTFFSLLLIIVSQFLVFRK